MDIVTGPAVSIIIPCYNKRAYVAATIASALAQTHPCEVIVVDDGSTDGSLNEVRRFDGRIRWASGPNRGGSAARNAGLAMASGDWIQFLDADDILPPDKIAVQVAALGGMGGDTLAVCPWSLLHDDGRIDPPDARRYWRDHATGADLLIDMWYRGGFFPPHAWLVNRALIARAGLWNETLTGDDDGEFFARMLLAAGPVRFCHATRVLYRDPPAGAVSRDRSQAAADSFWRSFVIGSAALLARRTDRAARLACLSRARKTAYAWRSVPAVLDAAAAWERTHWHVDPSPSLPGKTRLLVALFGLKRGLALRDRLAR